MTIRDDLDRLDRSIRQLKIDSDRFFNGALPTPPEDLRKGVYEALREVRNRPLLSYAERFFLNSLEARLNTLDELYHRRLREAEMGSQAASPPAASPVPLRSAGVVFDEGRGAFETAQILYEELYGDSGRERKTDFASFFDFLRDKAAKIRRMTGRQQVQFRVDRADGRPTLRAKAVRPEAAGEGSE